MPFTEEWPATQSRASFLAATLSSYMVSPYVVAASDLIATLPLSIAKAAAKANRLALLEVPLNLPALSVSLYWHDRYQDDAGHAWLRQYIAEHAGQP